MAIDTAMILAAGKGERLQPLTFTTPKPLLPIYGQAFIIYHIKTLTAHGIKKIVINVSHLAEQIIKTLGDGSKFNVEIIYSFEETPLGAGGGIRNALPLLGDKPFLLVSSDIYTNFPFEKLINMNCSDNFLLHAVVTDKRDYDTGDFDLVDGHLTLTAQPQYIFGSIAVMHPELFRPISPGFATLMPVFTMAIEQQQASGEYYQNILNVNTLTEYQILQQSSPF